MKVFDWYVMFFLVLLSGKTTILSGAGDVEYKRKSFYIMKVIYNNIIYRALAINVRNVQQSLYMWNCKYKLKILKNGD